MNFQSLISIDSQIDSYDQNRNISNQFYQKFFTLRQGRVSHILYKLPLIGSEI